MPGPHRLRQEHDEVSAPARGIIAKAIRHRRCEDASSPPEVRDASRVGGVLAGSILPDVHDVEIDRPASRSPRRRARFRVRQPDVRRHPADLTGRSADRLTPPNTTPDIAGTVTRVVPGDSVFRQGTGGDPNAPVSCPPSCAPTSPPMRSVLVEELPGSASGDNKSVVKVPRDARVLRRVGGSVTEVGFDYLRAGLRVEAWFEGPVLESYPTQSTARVIMVVE